MDNLLLLAFIAAIGINVILFVPAFLLKTDKLTDFSYSLSFAVVAIAGFALSAKTSIHTLAFVAVLLWSIRLGGFLVMRIRAQGGDHRFDEMREHLWPFLRFWLTQGLAVWIILLPALFLWQTKDASAGVVSYVGLAIFATGLILEAVADLQKFRFKTAGTSRSWIDQGVWRISRHPNYLGEIMVWIGMYYLAVPALSTNERLLGLASPLFIAVLLMFISGIPILEKSAEKRWGKQLDYKAYKKVVPILIPTPRSIGRLFR